MKHAYLIIAHNQFDLLKKLIHMLDYSNNDIYIHIDKKVPDSDYNNLTLSTEYAKLFFTERYSVTWGNYSMIQAEMALLNEATKNYHDYYHLLSGVDLPIKDHGEIDAFFQENIGLEFVSFDTKACEDRIFENRCKYYHILPHYIRLDRQFLRIQNFLKINRINSLDIKLMKGSQWFDITHECAVYICQKMSDRRFDKIFRYSSCADEIFVQTILYNSDFFSRKADYGIRFIDWSKHGRSPETLTVEYWQQIQQSDMIYARKFNQEIDREIVEKIELKYGKE